MKNNYIAIGLSCLVLAALIFIKQIGIASWSSGTIAADIFIFFGLSTFITALHKINRSIIFVTSVLLLIGIIITYLGYSEILDPFEILLSTILFAAGGGLLVLFIDNPKEPIILYLSLILLCLSVIAVYFQKSSVIIDYATEAAIKLFDFWPVLLLIFGIILIIDKRK